MRADCAFVIETHFGSPSIFSRQRNIVATTMRLRFEPALISGTHLSQCLVQIYAWFKEGFEKDDLVQAKAVLASLA